MKDVYGHDSRRGAATKLRSGGVRMGKPPLYEEPARKRGRERSELKHLSRSWKINQRDSVSKRRANAEQPKPHLCGVAGQTTWDCVLIVEQPGKAGHRP